VGLRRNVASLPPSATPRTARPLARPPPCDRLLCPATLHLPPCCSPAGVLSALEKFSRVCALCHHRHAPAQAADAHGVTPGIRQLPSSRCREPARPHLPSPLKLPPACFQEYRMLMRTPHIPHQLILSNRSKVLGP
jgi:hypothetical protein